MKFSFQFDTKKAPASVPQTHASQNLMTISRPEFLSQIPKHLKGIEIGPFANPLLSGPNIKYLDVLPTEELITRATSLGLDPTKVPDISYVSNSDGFPKIQETFEFAISSHSIEHHPDLIKHLNQVSSVLSPRGKYFLIIPDKRYCFDHFIAESTIADVIDAYLERRKVHTAKSVIEHRALTTHNDPALHFSGNHGSIQLNQHERVKSALDEMNNAQGSYIDVHAWQFVPTSFAEIINQLASLDLIDFEVQSIWDTALNTFEFMAVLQKF